MKKLIFTSMLAAAGLFAQSSSPAPAPQKQNNAAPASQTPATTQHKKHKKSTKPSGTANSNAAPANSNAAPASSSSSTPAAPAKK